MDRDTISKLRLDRRLSLRRGWISPDDLDRELEELPDVSSKIAPAGNPPGEEAESDAPAQD